MSHCDFHVSVMQACFDMPATLAKKRKKRKRTPESPEKRTRGEHDASAKRHAEEDKRNADRAPSLTAKGLQDMPRFDGRFHGVEDIRQGRSDPRRTCQWCRYKQNHGCGSPDTSKSSQGNRAHLRCATCKVYFCSGSCFTDFHSAGAALNE